MLKDVIDGEKRNEIIENGHGHFFQHRCVLLHLYVV